MFKSKEELKKEQHESGHNMFDCGIELAFKSFEERIEFCKKYVDKYNTFYDEHPELIEKFDKERVSLRDKGFLCCFNYWLFNYCFGDLIE